MDIEDFKIIKIEDEKKFKLFLQDLLKKIMIILMILILILIY